MADSQVIAVPAPAGKPADCMAIVMAGYAMRESHCGAETHPVTAAWLRTTGQRSNCKLQAPFIPFSLPLWGDFTPHR